MFIRPLLCALGTKEATSVESDFICPKNYIYGIEWVYTETSSSSSSISEYSVSQELSSAVDFY